MLLPMEQSIFLPLKYIMPKYMLGEKKKSVSHLHCELERDRCMSPIPITRKVCVDLIGCCVPLVGEAVLGCGAVSRQLSVWGRDGGAPGWQCISGGNYLMQSVLRHFCVVRPVWELKGLSLPAGAPGLRAELAEMNQNTLIESNHSLFNHLRMWAKRRRKGDN